MFKKKKKEKISEKIDSIEISAKKTTNAVFDNHVEDGHVAASLGYKGEETPKYEMLVGVFEPDIITRLEPKQVLPYMPSIDPILSDKIKNISEIDRAVASGVLLDAIKQSRDRGIWREFMTALEGTKYIALRQKLHGDSVHDDTNERRYIEIMTPQLRQIINPCEITPALLSRDVLIQEDVEEITCEANNRGSIAATDLLLKRVSGKHPKWYTELVAALFTSGMSDAGDILLEGLNQIPERSKDSISYLTRSHVPKTELKGTHSRSKSVKERNPKTEVKGMHPVSNSVKERNPTQGNGKKQQRPHSSVTPLYKLGNQPSTQGKYYITPVMQRLESEEHVYDVVSDEDSLYKTTDFRKKEVNEDAEVDIADTASYKESVHEQQQFQTEIKDRVETANDIPYLCLDRALVEGTNDIATQYSTSLPKVPPRLPMRISKDRVESMPMKEQDEYEDTDLMNVKRETIYVYSVEDRDAIYQGHRSFQKGEIIRVIKPKDDEQDEEYYQCDDEAGNLIPKSCVEVIDIPKRKHTSNRKSTSSESASVATDTQIPESMIKTVNQMLSDLLKKHKVLEQHVEVLKEQRGVRENEDDDEEDLENITSLC
ncbi:uncharacterized protein LOC128236509 isoform X2 [Mya arenaria]|uniref:uncharacterized protein LOC128236509 isoform X2 n=1 Tax=Mya arenaria TaxID=6604 RepID=UPI0022E770C9|nr:uncharacterized protein LOC128236509 isoform X2 [Mya arenaria]